MADDATTISELRTRIREFTDDEGSDVKISDARLDEYIRRATADVVSDVNRVSTMQLRARVEISVVANQREYVLPPNIHKIYAIEKRDNQGDIEWELKPRHVLNPSGPGFSIEGPMLYLDPRWEEAQTLTILYVPTAESPMFDATTSTHDASTLTVPASVTTGSVDERPHSYVGYILRILTSGKKQDRVISSEDRTTPDQPVFTVKPDFSPALSGATVFEVIPQHMYRFRDLIALRVSRTILNIMKDREGAQVLHAEYRDALRNIRQDTANLEQRKGKRFERAIRGRRFLGKTG